MKKNRLYEKLNSLTPLERQEIKSKLSLDVGQALRILKEGRRLTTLTMAKYGYYFNEFRPRITQKFKLLDEAFNNYNDTGFYKDYMIKKGLEEF